MGRKGPYLLLREKLIPGLNRPVQSQAVNLDKLGHCRASGGPPGGAGRRSQRPEENENLAQSIRPKSEIFGT
jgi:hypothetical protein